MEKATCIFLITASLKIDCKVEIANTTENIIYAYLKDVYDFPPKDKIYFYPKYGRNDIAKHIANINNYNFKQWFAISNLLYAKEIFKKIQSGERFKIDTIEANFVFDGAIKLLNTAKIDNKESDTPCSTYKYEKYNYDDSEFLKKIYFDSFKDDFAKNLNDLQDNNYSSKIFPFGFLFLPQLRKDLENKICIVRQQLFIPNNMHGERGEQLNDKQLPQNFIGFIQDSPIPRESLGVLIKENDDFENLSCSKSVNVTSGLWTFKTKKPIGNGFWAVVDKKNNSIIAKEEFSLIMSFNTNIGVISDKVTDLYDKEISFVRTSRDQNKTIRSENLNKVFFRENFSNHSDEEYDIMISEWFENLLIHCSPNIRIYDPYLLGEFKQENSEVKINRSQRIFLNALIHASTRVKIESIEFLCMKNRVKGFWRDRNNFPVGYAELFNQINKICNFKVSIRVYDKIFHDRYVIKNQDNPEIIQLSVSINGLVAEDEIKFHSLSDLDNNKISTRISHLWDISKNNEVSNE